MSSEHEDIYVQLCELLQPFNANDVPLRRETDISGDLNIDSVSVMDFVMEVEDKFDIDIPLNLLTETRTLDDLTKLVAQRTSGA